MRCCCQYRNGPKKMLTQTEADRLIAMGKRFRHRGVLHIGPGTDNSYELLGHDKKETFLLDIWQGTIRLSKMRLQNRARTVYVLVRLDVNGPPHTNPDGEKIGGTHIHVYREGFESKWACPLNSEEFPDVADNIRLLRDFCRRCNVVDTPDVQRGLM